MTEIRLRELLSGLDTGDIVLSWLSDEINKDMEAFAEWCDDLSLYYHSAVDNIWIKMGDEGERFTTAKLREIWEKERKEES